MIDAGVDVRAATRRPESAGLPAAVEAVRGDLEQPHGLASALEGVDALYLIATQGLCVVD
ncbi:NAD(P)H-binding protein [Micromonospora sp. MW-13]|uniref:NAD(P)H-binding protein n=1 Tax=Micromonospora sp. MW-13 TaxID=2094022 RepID=UPI000E43FBAF